MIIEMGVCEEMTHDGPHAQLLDVNIVRDNFGLCALVERGIEHRFRILMELLAERRPAEVERHGSRFGQRRWSLLASLRHYHRTRRDGSDWPENRLN